MKSPAAGHATKPGVSSLLLLLAVLIVVGILLFPVRQEPSNSLPSLKPGVEQMTTTVAPESVPVHVAKKNGVAAEPSWQTKQTSTDVCDQDPGTRTLQQYRKFSAQDWRSLNQWQQERGLSQTRLRADQELMQEPSPYLQYDPGSLQSLANSGDADAQYWLAMKYRELAIAQVPSGNGNDTEDAQLVIARLLQQAAQAGHVQAMLAISQRYHEQLPTSQPEQAFPDLQIKARAWTHVAAWRLGQLADTGSALPVELEAQAAQLASQLISDMQQQRQQEGLPPFSNVVPDAVIGLLQAGSAEQCRHLTQPRLALGQLAD